MIFIYFILFLTLLIILIIKFKKQKNIYNKAMVYTENIESKLFEADKNNRRLIKTNKKLALSQEIAQIGTWYIGQKESIPYWSDETYKIFGKNEDIFIPTYKNVIGLFEKKIRQKINKQFLESVKYKTKFKVLVNIYHENGFIHNLEIKACHSFNTLDERIDTTGIVIDVTQRIKLENVLKQMNKNLDERIEEEVFKNKRQQDELFRQSRMAQLGEMLSMIAHQWRQPLGAISSISIDLNMKLELEKFNLKIKEEQEECQLYFKKSLYDIDELIEGLSNTIDDFRNFYKPNKKTKKTKLNSPIDKALKIIKPSFITNNIQITEQYSSNEMVDLYEGELIQVILNILQNAQDNFNDKKIKNASINIKVYDTPGYISLDIVDNGGGIDDEIIDNIFDPYYSTKDEKNGTGLGLYMSKIIISEHHNGRIEAKNTDDGVCFSIRLKNEKV